MSLVLVAVAVHVIAAAAIAGGALYFINNSAARMTSLGAAVGWLLMAAVLGGGMTWSLAIVTGLSALGGLLGFLPALASADRAPAARGLPGSRRYEARTAASSADRPGDESDGLPYPAREAVEDHSKPFVAPVSWPVLDTDPRIRNDNYHRPNKPRRSKARTGEIVGGAVALAVILIGGAFFGYQIWSATEPGAAKAVKRAEASSSPVASAEPSSATETVEVAALPSTPLAFSSLEGDSSSSGVEAAASVLDPSSAPSASMDPQFASLPPISSSPTDSSSSASSAVATTAAFATPSDYCASVKNIDTPDMAKVSGGVQQLFVQARAAAKLTQGDVHWRCMDGAVWICATTAGGLACDKVPTSVDRVLICAAHPDAKGIRTAAGDWSCDGFTPVVTPAQLQAPDRRGFDKGVWSKFAETAAAN